MKHLALRSIKILKHGFPLGYLSIVSFSAPTADNLLIIPDLDTFSPCLLLQRSTLSFSIIQWSIKVGLFISPNHKC